jgi:K+-sensing histidine kinase KdpD
MPKNSPDDSLNAEIVKLFPLWRHDGLEPLTSIIGYATLLLDSNAENLTEQQKQFIAVIRNVAMRASTSWHSTGDYVKLCFDFEHTNWQLESVQLSKICDTILSSSFKYINKSNVRVDIPADLAPVKANSYWLSVAITNLLEPNVGYFYSAAFESSISAQRSDDSHILVVIRAGLELPMDENRNSIESISSPGNNLSVANIILDKHGSRLAFKRLRKDNNEYESQGVEFEFGLPIWK